ncbi:MAG: hypothetical protein KC657_00100 [Myxococcales bacterium]|nr:hypothetical protein [Myxococcales bacterium]
MLSSIATHAAQNHPLVALRALRALAEDPDDLPRVFTVIESLPGRAPVRTAARTRATPEGARLLADKPDLRALLSDRDALLAMPEGSLGRAYAEMTAREGISADGIVEANERGHVAVAGNVDRDVTWMNDRMRDTHDLWHVVTGYGTDVLGETGLLAFSYAQTRHPGVALILGLAIVKRVPGVAAIIKDGFRRGRRAGWMPAARWEELLPLPLADVRARLGVEPVPPYARLTSDELRARFAS